LYFLFRHFWKKARLMRAERDLALLPMRYFPPADGTVGEGPRQMRATLLPDLEPYMMVCGREVPGNPPYLMAAGEMIGIPGETRRIELSRGGDGESYLFGAYGDADGAIRMRKPEDPMAELVLVAGNPEVIAAACGRTARRYEIVSALIIGANVSINVTAILFLLSYIVG
jgi:hypothetical protein